MQPQVFQLVRFEDESGVSGVGIVADGVRWPDGSASLRWRGDLASLGFYSSMADLVKIHGHGGKTRVRML